MAEADRRVRIGWAPGAAILDIDGIGVFRLDFQRQRVHIESADSRHDAGIEEAVLGPAMLLQLAARNVWALHASAIQAGLGDELLVFVGDSGAGKSTLARRLAAHDPGFARVADDIVLAGFYEGRLVAFPRYPQLKLDGADQYAVERPARLIVGAIVLLDRDISSRRARTESLSPREAALALSRHTASSRLLNRDRLAAHLDFCANAGRSTRILTLRYGSGDEAFKSVPGVLRDLIR